MAMSDVGFRLPDLAVVADVTDSSKCGAVVMCHVWHSAIIVNVV